MKEITFGMESRERAGCERILAEGWKVLVTKDKKVKLWQICHISKVSQNIQENVKWH